MIALFEWIWRLVTPVWKPKTEIDFACLHESGHAVVSKATGCFVHRVIAKEEGEIRIGFTDYDLPPGLSFAAERAMEIGILHGGKAAEGILGGRKSSKGILKDEQDIQDQIAQLTLMASLDFTEEELLGHCENRACEIIRANRTTVLRLAGLLSKQGVVEGNQLQTALNRVQIQFMRQK